MESRDLPEPHHLPIPRWVTPVLAATAIALVPWTLWLTFSLPARHISEHYDLAWVGFDIALFAAFVATAFCLWRSSQWLVPVAAVTGTMLVCDAWFDVVTSARGELGEAVIEAVLAELPLAAVCAFIILDVERFQRATVERYASAVRRRRES